MAVTGVLVDANVLYSRTLRDWLFLLKLESSGGMFIVYATEDIIAEVLYHLRRKNPMAPGSLIGSIRDSLVDNLDEVVKDFDVDDSFPGTDENDAHVHAAAVACKANIVLTDDTGWSFDAATSDELPYEVHTADSFFVLIDDSSPQLVRQVVQRQMDYWKRKLAEPELPDSLRRAGCPQFAERVALHLGGSQLF